jgi:hypothetical protein
MRWQIANKFADQHPGNAGSQICDVPNWPGGPGWLLFRGFFTGGALLDGFIEVDGLSAPIPDLAAITSLGNANEMRPFSAPAGTIVFGSSYPNPGDTFQDLQRSF